MTVSGGARVNNNVGVGGGINASGLNGICNLYLNRFRTNVSDPNLPDDRREGDRPLAPHPRYLRAAGAHPRGEAGG